jgi:hypothetical protein
VWYALAALRRSGRPRSRPGATRGGQPDSRKKVCHHFRLFGQLSTRAPSRKDLRAATGYEPAAVELRPVAPTLEDVFVTLSRSEARRRAS